MKEKMILIAFCMTIMFSMSACSGNTINSGDNQNAGTEISTSENAETESSEENVKSEGTAKYQLTEKDESAEDEAIGDSSMTMKIGDTKVNVDWEDNQAVERLQDMAEDGNIPIQMSMYGGFEQVGSIGQSLPRDDKQTTTRPGDIVLYSGNQMVVFYGSNSWSYTRLGHISDKDEAEMADLLSQGDVKITISIEQAFLEMSAKCPHNIGLIQRQLKPEQTGLGLTLFLCQ